jgi:hypothetical protein
MSISTVGAASFSGTSEASRSIRRAARRTLGSGMKSLLRAACLLLVLPCAARALDLQQFMAETQRMKRDKDEISIVWWLPTKYWQESMSNATPAQRGAIVQALEPYAMFVVARIKPTPLATMKSVPRAELVDALDVKFNGHSLEIVPERQLSPEVRNFLQIMKPVMSNLLGQMGEGLEFLMVRNAADGKTIIDAEKPGALEATFFNAHFAWGCRLGRCYRRSSTIKPARPSLATMTSIRSPARALP